jgi:transcriptional regulator with XRE-family HTH domain
VKSYKIVLTWRNYAIGYKNKQDIDMKDTERHHYIGEHICALRESKGWTQQTLGKKLGKKTSTISAYETNAKLPSADCLIEMAEVFGVSIDTLVYGETADLVSVRTLNPAQKALVAEILQVFGSNSPQKSASEQRLRLVGNLVNLLI